MKLNNRSQKGFTLIELTVVLSIVAVLATQGMKIYKHRVLDQGLIKITADRYYSIRNAVLRYRSDNRAWPGSMSVLVNANYLESVSTVTPWGNNFSIRSTGNDLVLTVPLKDTSFAIRMLRYVSNGTRLGSNITDIIKPPGQEASNSILYARDGSNGPMLASMNMGGNNISNVSNVSTGSVTASGNITGSRLSATQSVVAPRYTDTNSAYYVDPSSTSQVNALTARGTINGPRLNATQSVTAPRFNDTNSNYYLDPSSRSLLNTMDIFYLRDRNNLAYKLDPSSTSRLNYVDANVIRLSTHYGVGGGCSTKQVGTTSSGELLSCVNGRWTKTNTPPSVTVSNGARGRGTHTLGWFHVCSGAGMYNTGSSKNQINSYIYPSGGRNSRGEYNWILRNASEKSYQQMRYTCWKLR